MTPEFIKESNRLILMIDATYLQATMIKGTPELKQRMKQIFAPFWNHGKKLSKQLRLIGEINGKSDQLDQESAFVYEALREICEAKNKNEALALLQSYNKGEVIVFDNERSE